MYIPAASCLRTGRPCPWIISIPSEAADVLLFSAAPVLSVIHRKSPLRIHSRISGLHCLHFPVYSFPVCLPDVFRSFHFRPFLHLRSPQWSADRKCFRFLPFLFRFLPFLSRLPILLSLFLLYDFSELRFFLLAFLWPLLQLRQSHYVYYKTHIGFFARLFHPKR